MSGIINSSEWGAALLPGVNKFFGMGYSEHPEEWPDLVDVETPSFMSYMVEEVGQVGLGLAKAKSELDPWQYEGTEQGFVTRYVYTIYGLGMIISAQVIDDDQYGVVAPKKAKHLGFSMRQTKERVVANIYNRAFTAGYTGGDGVVLCSDSHPNKSGGTYLNTRSLDFSEKSLEQACIDIMKMQNDKGHQISAQPVSLHVPVELVFEAERLLMTPGRVGTANNDINALRSTSQFPGGIKVNHYFTDPGAWFIRTNVPDGMKLFQRWPLKFDQDNNFDNMTVKFIAFERYDAGWTDPRGIWGSDGL